MKNSIIFTTIVVMVVIIARLLFFPNVKTSNNLLTEKKLSYEYFNRETNLNDDSAGYGLVRDRAPSNPEIASIAATGYGLSSIPIAIKEGWITENEGRKRAEKTLDTFLAMENINGFYYHFVNVETGEREWDSEISNIDTAIFLSGAIHVGEYFGGVVNEKANSLYQLANWDWFVDHSNNQFYMAYSPENGFLGHWDFYAEQLLMYILGSGSPTFPIDKNVYDAFIKNKAAYGSGEAFIHSWFGSIFTYQFSHAWLDFRFLDDSNGINWFKNSVDASIANYDFSYAQGEYFKTFKDGGWGITASDSPTGYNGKLGTAPSGFNDDSHEVDGTVAPAGAIGSIVFTPDKSNVALDYYYTIEGLVGKYGLKDAYNIDKNWIANDFIGIDKGITLLMIENYQTSSIWNYFMQNKHVMAGFENLGFVTVKEN
jgi:hypothetical protein